MWSLDLETTSADPDEARIVQASLVIGGGGQERDTLTLLVNPGVEIPQEAIDVHGITNEQAQAEGIDPRQALVVLMAALGARRAEPLIVCNAPYDCTVLDRELRRHDFLSADSAGWNPHRIVDTLEIDHHLHRYRAGSRKLVDTCAFYGVNLGELAHDAAFDAVAAAKLAWLLCSRGYVKRRTRGEAERGELAQLQMEWYTAREDLDRLHVAQRGWARDRRERLQRYLWEGNVGKGVPPQPDRVVELDWPVVPFDVAKRARVEPPARQGELRTPMQSEAELTTPEWTR